MFKNNLKRKLSKSFSYLAIITMLVPTAMTGGQAFANELEASEESSEVTDQTTDTTTSTSESVEIGENTLDIPSVNENLLSIIEGDITTSNGMYTVGQTQDGRVIQSSAITSTNTRATGNVRGEIIRITISGVLYEGVKITIDGKGALCIDKNLRAPFEPNVPYDNGVPYENIGVKAILANGAYGPLNPNPTDEEILLTEIALRNWLTGNITVNQAISNSHPYVADLIAKAKAGQYFNKNISFSSNFVTSDIVGNEQVSKKITVSGDSDNYVSIPVPKDITLTNKSTGEKITNGVAKVYGGQSFVMSTSLSYNQKYSSGKVKSAYGEYVSIMFTPFDAGYQRLVQGKFSDPLEIQGFEVDFFARLGNAEFQKLSEFSNLPMEGVKYNVEETGKAPYQMTTDSKGMLNFLDRLHDTVIRVTEIENPLGWVLDPTTYELTITGGQTVTKKLMNKLQMGKIKGLKKQTVLDVAETKKLGEPVYKKIALAGAKFNIVAEKDIYLPDGKTLYVAKGTIVDTVVTDDKGYFESTKELLAGKDSMYRLVEVNVPEGYRAPSEDQTLFSIPNGNNTEKLIVFDLGTIDNELQTGKLNFLKRDSIAFAGIEGASFTVEMMSGLYKGTYFSFQTKAEGNEFELPVGDWKLTEIKLPNGFTFDEGTPQTQWVTIKDNETIELNWNNKKLVPEVGISTQAHTGDGTSQTFVWGEEAKFYDDSKLEHKDIPVGTKRAYETKLHAIYADGTQAVVWKSGLVDYTVTDKEMTERAIAEYDYRKDSKADEKTRWYFSEDGYNYDNEKPKKDKEHNPEGKDPKQQITPVKKPVTPTTPKTPTTPQKAVGTFPQTGEKESVVSLLVGLMTIVAFVGFYVIKKRKESTVE